jgi:hypothetical protein
MRKLFFWQHWPAPERILFYIAALFFAFSIANLAYSYLETPAPVFAFQSIVEAQLTEVPFETSRKGLFDLIIPGNNYTVTERLLGTPLKPNLTASYLWLASFVIGITGLLAIVTTLSRFYYLASMGVFILLVVSLKLETLLMFGRSDKLFTVGVLLVYGICSLHVYYLLPGLKIAQRFLYFLSLTLVVGALITFTSETAYPALQLATHSLPAGMITCALFIMMVAHEIIASFIGILTRNTGQGRTLTHFLLITMVYLLNLIAAYSVKFKFISWDIYTIDLFLLLVISGVLGIWGIRQRQKPLGSIIDVEPCGVIGYLLLGIMTFGAIASFTGTANDPAYDAVADLIIFSHLGYGFIFLLYVISNFGGMLTKNMAVHKVLYNPTTMPFFTFRLAGLITILALAIYNTWQVPAHNAVAGYQNAIGDLYLLEGNGRVASIYYDQGRAYGYSNHHSTYALANIAALNFDHDGEKSFYRGASYTRPTEMSYLNWAQTWQSEDNAAQAIAVLKTGLERFPNSTAISNTIGLLYAESNKPDSAAMYLKDLPATYSQTNLLALASRGKLQLLADTAYRQTDDAGLMGNKIAYSTSIGKESEIPLSIPVDSSISLSQATYINNYIVNHPGKIDTATLARVSAIARVGVNSSVSEALLLASALGSYSIGDIRSAFTLLEEVAIVSANKGKFNSILGLWCLDQDEPVRASGYIDFASAQEYPGSAITSAVAHTECLRYAPLNRSMEMRRALDSWDSLTNVSDSAVARLAHRMTAVLTAQTPEALADDESKYAFVRYRVLPWNAAEAIRILSSVADPNMKTRGFLEASQLLIDYDLIPAAVMMFNNVRNVTVTDPRLYDALRLHERRLLALAGNIDGLRKALETPLILSSKNEVYNIYFDALIANAAGDTILASKKFEAVAHRSLFFVDGIVAATSFFASHQLNSLAAYDLLVDALQHHPSSIRLRKAYIREAIRANLGFFTNEPMQELEKLIPRGELQKFANEVGYGASGL